MQLVVKTTNHSKGKLASLFILALTSLLLLYAISYYQKNEHSNEVFLSPYASMLIDETDSLNIDSIIGRHQISPKFTHHPYHNKPLILSTEHINWIKVQGASIPKSTAKDLYLYIPYRVIDRGEIYYFDKSHQLRSKKIGRNSGDNNANLGLVHYFVALENIDTDQPWYLYIDSRNYSPYKAFSAHLLSPTSYTKKYLLINGIALIFYTLIACTVFAVSILSFASKNKALLLYAAYVLSLGIMISMGDGIYYTLTKHFFTNNLQMHPQIITIIMVIIHTSFFVEILDLKTKKPFTLLYFFIYLMLSILILLSLDSDGMLGLLIVSLNAFLIIGLIFYSIFAKKQFCVFASVLYFPFCAFMFLHEYYYPAGNYNKNNELFFSFLLHASGIWEMIFLSALSFHVFQKEMKEKATLKQTLIMSKSTTEELQARNSNLISLFTSFAHDLKQPLHGALLLSNSLLHKNTDLSLKGSLTEISKGLGHAAKNIDATLTKIKLELGYGNPTIKPSKLKPMINNSIDNINSLAKNNSIHIRTKNIDHEVITDEFILQRVIYNIILNSVSHNQNCSLLIGCRNKGDHIRLDIIDNGKGFSINMAQREDDHKNIVPISGGFGLTIIKKLCEIINHPMEVKSEKGKGTFFSVYIPTANNI